MFGFAGTNITILSGLFTISFLIVMAFFALSNLLLKVNRDRLIREPRVGLPIVILALAIVAAGIAGNIVLSPKIIGYFSVFFVATLAAMMYSGFQGKLAVALYWLYTRNTRLHSWRWTRNWHIKLVNKIKRSKIQPIVFFAKTDEVQLSINLE